METPFAPYQHCLLFTTNAFARILNKMAEPFFSEVGLTTTHAFILMTVADRPGITVTDLAAVVLLDNSTVTRALEKMDRNGLVFKNIKGKMVEVFPSVDGMRRVNDARAAWGKLHAKLAWHYPGQQEVQTAGEINKCIVRYFELK